MYMKKSMNRLVCCLASVILLILWPLASYAHNHFIRINELMAGYNGDSNFQFIEIGVESDTKNALSDNQRQWGPKGAAKEDGEMMLVFHDVLGNETGQYIFPHHAPSKTNVPNVPGDDTNAARTVLVATQVFVDTMAANGFPIRPDFIMPPNILPISGKVCLRNNPRGTNQFTSNQCVSYGGFSGATETTKASFNSASFTNKVGKVVAAPNRGLPIVIDPSNPLFTNDSNLNTSGGLLTHAVSLTRVRNNSITAFPSMSNNNVFDNTDFELRRPTPSSTRSINNGTNTQLEEHLEGRLTNALGETNFTFPLASMAEQGQFLFEQETFQGNGRTCVDCHRPPHFGLTPTQVDALQASRDGINLMTASNNQVRDFFTPLFIGEFNLNVLKLTETARPSDLHGVIRDSAGHKALVIAGSGDTYLIYGGLDFSGTVTDEGVVIVPEYDARINPTPSTASIGSTTIFNNNFGTIASVTPGDLGDVSAGNNAGLEHPAMMKEVTASGFKRNLIVENVNGINEGHMLRSVPHLIDIAMSGPYGWSPTEGGSPELGGFCNGAIQQHASRSLFRRHLNDTNPDADITAQFIASRGNEFGVSVPADENTFRDIDVRIMTRDEIRAMDAFQRQIGASQMMLAHLDLTAEQMADFVPTQAQLSPSNVLDFSPIATTLAQRRGEDLFFGTALCSVCHNGPALANTDGRFGTVAGESGSFDTGSADVELGDNLPDEKTNGGARRLFNVSPLIGIATTPPYFHNHSAETLLASVSFYDTPAFLNSPAATQLALSTSNTLFNSAQEIADVTSFLESLVDLPFTFTLQGRAAPAKWATNVTAAAPIDFGTLAVGNTSSAMTVVIQNISGQNLIVLNAVVREETDGLSVDDDSNFSLSSNFAGTTLGLTDVDVADVQFHPQNGGLNQASLEVTVQDSDSGETWQVGFALQGTAPAGFTVSEVSGSTSEGGNTATFTVQLDTTPSDTVQIDIISSNEAEGIASAASLTFTPANALTPQTVTLTGQDDQNADGTVSYDVEVKINAGATLDSNYDNLPSVILSVDNLDNDIAGLSVTPSNGLSTTELGGTDSFTVQLNTVPQSSITVALTVISNATEVSLSSSSLTFNADATALTPQTVTITGQDDALQDGNKNFSIEVSISNAGSDPNYGSASPVIINGQNLDNDVPAIFVSPTSLNVTEAGNTASFNVNLTTLPLVPVTIILSNTDNTELSIDKNVFSLSDLTPITVTVTGKDDNDVDGDQTVIIVLNASSSDPAYNSLNPDDVSVTVQDDDQPAILVSETSLSVTEAGSTASFSVSLTSVPSAPVTINLTNGDNTELSLDKTVLSLNSLAPAVVTVTGQDDSEVDGNKTVTITLSASSADPIYNSLNPDDVSVIVQDDDVAPTNPPSTTTAEVSLILGQFTVNEGNKAQVRVNRLGDTSATASVDYITTQQTAVLGKQYANAEGTLTWAANDTSSRVIEITTLDDGVVTTQQYNFLISLLNPVGVTLGTHPTATISILNTTQTEETCGEGGCEGEGNGEGEGETGNSKDIVMFGAAVFTALEGDMAEISVYRLGTGQGSVSVNYQMQAATADSSDFVNNSGLLSWSDGDLAPKTFTVTLLQDSIVENTEYLKLQLTNPVNTNIGFMSELRIIDDDVAAPVAEEVESAGIISLSSAAFTVGEANGSLNLPLNRSNGSAGAVSVQVQLQAGTATEGADYLSTTLTASWADGESAQKSVSIPIVDDALAESSENFAVNISVLSGAATLGQSTASVTILDNESSEVNSQLNVLNFSPVQYSVNEGDGSVNLIVIREGNNTSPLQARVIALMGQGENEARAGEDFSYISTVLTWGSGDSSQRMVNIHLVDDDDVEAVEKVSFLLLPSSSGVISSNNQAELILLDNDVNGGNGNGGGVVEQCGQTIQHVCALSASTLLMNPTITNQGHLIGGQLSGNIANNGILENVRLAANSKVTGNGRLRGNIAGEANAPSVLTGQTIDSGAVLSYVIIGIGIDFAGQVQFGEGVQFASADLIPKSISFNALLPRAYLTNCLTQTAPVWLDGADVIANGDILNDLNQFANPFSLKPPLSQWRNGIVVYDAGSTQYAVVPRQVYQADSYTKPGAEIRRNGEILLTTPNGRTVLTQPALQGECELQATASAALGRRVSLQAADNGSVMFARSSTEYMIFRPDYQSVLADSGLVEGFNYLPTLYGLANQALISFVFKDSNGILRQQHLLPTLANAEALTSAVHNLSIAHNGLITFFANGQAYQGVPSYEVRLMSATGTTQVRVITDMNDDGMDDMEIEYSNGHHQVLYLIKS